MKYRYIWLLLPLIFCGCSATTTKVKQEEPHPFFSPKKIQAPLVSINIIDRNGLTETVSSKDRLDNYKNVNFLSHQPYTKVLRVFAKDKEGTATSQITSYHPNGQVKQYLEVENGRAHGSYAEWHANGKMKLSAFVIQGIPDIDERSELTWLFDGTSRAWDEEGRLLTAIFYKKGELADTSRYFHPDGSVAKEIPYVNGEMHGAVKCFYPGGALAEITHFAAGVLAGDSETYWPDTRLACKEFYEKGLLKQGAYYTKNGELVASIAEGTGKRCVFDENGPREFHEWKNGKAEGEVVILTSNNFVITRYFIKNNEKHGSELRYYPPPPFTKTGEGQPQPKLVIEWYEGKIHGLVKTWYDNGIQESQREMSNNLKQGIFTAWYRDGSLMFIEEYEKDKLVRGEYSKKDTGTPISKVEKGKGEAYVYDGDGNFCKKIRYTDGKPIEG